MNDDPAHRRGARSPTGRRSRSPVYAPVRATVRRPVIAASTIVETQPPQTGLPEPPPPSPPLRRRKAEDDPFASLGLRLGAVTVYPALQESIGYDSNPNRAAGPVKGSFVSRTEGEVRLQSDWARHELSAVLRGGYSDYAAVPDASRPDGSAALKLRLDASRDTEISLEGAYLLDAQRPGSPDLNARVRGWPLVNSYGGAVGVTQRFNRLVLTLRGSLDRVDYDDAKLSNGGSLDQSDRNADQYKAQLRLGYQLTPAVTPFIEGSVDTRRHDRPIDFAGYARDSDGISGRIGSSFELTRLLTGELAAGYLNRTYADPRLRDLNGPLLEGALAWALTPLTTIRAKAQTTVEETTVANASGILAQRGTIEVQHDLLRNLSLVGALSFGHADYEGAGIVEKSFTASLKAEYRVTRWLALRASYAYEQLRSSAPESSYTANVFLVGLRLNP